MHLPDSEAQHALVVGAFSAVVSGVQLWRRFAQRRPFSTGATARLFVLICLVAGLVAGLLAKTTVSALGVVGLGAAYAFAAPRPASGGPLRSQSRGPKGIGAVLWSVTGLL